jgi:glycosyltransferase involved in cell wall biosynthesis
VGVDGVHPTRSSGDGLPRLVWVTNYAAPYRRPVWRQLSESFDLQVMLTNDEDMATTQDRASWLGLDEDDYQLTLAEVRRTPIGHRSVLRGRHTLAQAVSECEAVLLGGWEEPLYWQGLLTAKRRKVPVFGFYESTLLSQHFPTGPVSWARSWFFRRLDGVVTPGPTAARAVRAMGVPDSRIHVGFNAVDVRRFHESAARSSARTVEPQPHGHRFIYVGQLIERKNVHGLIEAFARVAEPDDHLSIVGTGELESRLRALAEQHGLAERVSFLGNIEYDDLPREIAAEHTLVLPSTEEVWGLVVNEALASGLGVVVSDRCGVAESVNGMQGVVVCGTGVEDLSRALVEARRSWAGWIEEPEILQMTPERFAEVFRDCVLGAS